MLNGGYRDCHLAYQCEIAVTDRTSGKGKNRTMEVKIIWVNGFSDEEKSDVKLWNKPTASDLPEQLSLESMQTLPKHMA